MKQKIVLILSVVVGLVAFFLTGQYLESERAKLYKNAAKIEVLAAGRDLSAGTVIDPSKDLGRLSVYKTAVGENVCKLEDDMSVQGKKLMFPLKEGEPLLWTYLEMPESGRGGLASMIEPGLRAVSIGVSGPSAVSGLVQPNNRVDILGTFTFPSRKKAGETEAVTLTVLQDVTVLATGSKLGKNLPGASGQQGGSYSTVTLAVTPREAELLVFAQHVKGQLLLTLRNQDDLGFVPDMPEIDFQHLENKLPEMNEYRQKFIRHKKN